MKKQIIIIAFLFFLFNIAFCFAETIDVNSRITSVTIYPDSALITRSSNLKLTPGEHQIVFPDIIPEIDENSLRVSVGESEGIKILGAQLKKKFLEEQPSERVKQIEAQIQTLEDEKRKFEDSKKILSEEKEFLDSIRLFSKDQLPKDLVTKTPSAKDLEETFKFLDAKLKENYSLILDTELNLRQLQKKIDVLKNELAQVFGFSKKSKRSITVDLQVLKPLTCDLNVSYLVKGASWEAIYDARANFEKLEVELVSYGIIRQKTGEDWPEVEISLSTAKPAVGGRMPYVAPWFLKPYEMERMRGQGLGIKAGRLAQQYEAFDAEFAAKPEAPQVEYAAVEEKGIAVVYKIPHKANVKSDGSEHKLPVSSQILQARFEYSTYPRATPCAFLGSRVTNAKELQLLAGRVNIFLDGDFVGQSSLDNIGPGEEFDLYLGVDENVKVKREQIEKKVDDVLIAGIPSPTRKTTFKYKTTLENYKNKKINIILFEAMPVSQDEKIKVKIINSSLEPKEKDWQDRKGIWRFELELTPKEKKEIFYSFSVEHPRDMQLEGL
ncbi:MAG: mucoidy inhibitor MuiA family protein [Candidatus Omnitrophota bacterium]|nr:mucoidy inhibitor MuiA family protein [Candidatus Omnitrophota bacterium]